MYDNSNLAVRCRALWADVLCAVESRVFSVNEYVKNPHNHLQCHMVNADSVEIDYPSVKRRLLATLDLNEHAIQINEFHEDLPTSSEPFAVRDAGGWGCLCHEWTVVDGRTDGGGSSHDLDVAFQSGRNETGPRR